MSEQVVEQTAATGDPISDHCKWVFALPVKDLQYDFALSLQYQRIQGNKFLGLFTNFLPEWLRTDANPRGTPVYSREDIFDHHLKDFLCSNMVPDDYPQ